MTLHVGKTPLSVTIRLCTERDLPALEWDGMFSDHRSIIEGAFERQMEGTNIMLVAEMKGQIVGQIWIDLERAGAGSALLWAFRVHPAMQRCGIGTELLRAAEGWLVARYYDAAVIGVEATNDSARQLYLREGFHVLGPISESYTVTMPSGVPIDVTVEEVLMEKRLLAAGIAQ